MMDAHGNRIIWTTHPARQRLGSTIFAVVSIAAVSLLVAATMQQPLWGLFAAAVLLFALRRFFLPATYCIDDVGIEARTSFHRRQYAWAEIRRFQHDRRGGFVSTRARRSALDSLGGLHLLFGDDAETVIAEIKQRLRELC